MKLQVSEIYLLLRTPNRISSISMSSIDLFDLDFLLTLVRSGLAWVRRVSALDRLDLDFDLDFDRDFDFLERLVPFLLALALDLLDLDFDFDFFFFDLDFVFFDPAFLATLRALLDPPPFVALTTFL